MKIVVVPSIFNGVLPGFCCEGGQPGVRRDFQGGGRRRTVRKKPQGALRGTKNKGFLDFANREFFPTTPQKTPGTGKFGLGVRQRASGGGVGAGGARPPDPYFFLADWTCRAAQAGCWGHSLSGLIRGKVGKKKTYPNGGGPVPRLQGGNPRSRWF